MICLFLLQRPGLESRICLLCKWDKHYITQVKRLSDPPPLIFLLVTTGIHCHEDELLLRSLTRVIVLNCQLINNIECTGRNAIFQRKCAIKKCTVFIFPPTLFFLLQGYKTFYYQDIYFQLC